MNKEEFEAYFSDEDILIIDATEQRIVRPTDSIDQKDNYSGKKAHLLKSMIISMPAKTIKYISACYQRKCHDYQLLKIEFPPEKHWFEKFTIRVYLDYLGIKRDYMCANITISYKKTKLTSFNTTLDSFYKTIHSPQKDNLLKNNDFNVFSEIFKII